VALVEVVDHSSQLAHLVCLRVGRPQRDGGLLAVGPMGAHLLRDPVGNRLREDVGGRDDEGTAPTVGREGEGGDPGMVPGEVDDVGHVGPAPLVDRLVVVTHDAELGGWTRQQRDEPFLGRVHILVLVDDQVSEVSVHCRGDLRLIELADGPDHLLAKGEEPVALEGVEVAGDDRPQRLGDESRVEQFVLENVERLEQLRDRGEQPVPGVEHLQAETVGLAGEKRVELVGVEYVVRLVPRHPTLEELEAIGVDRPDEQAAEPVDRLGAEAGRDAMSDPVLELAGRALRERERHDPRGRDTVSQESHDALGHNLGLPRTRRRDDLHV
jgi:hypothetical protein